MRRPLAGLGGLLVLAAAAAHAFAGFKQFEPELARAGVGPEHVAGLKAGWLFGSACFLAIGLIALESVVSGWRGGHERHPPLVICGSTLIAFGLWAFLSHDFNTHFLGFVVMGALLLAAGLVRRSAPTPRN